MRRLVKTFICLFVTSTAIAQVNVTGTVIDKVSNEPLGGASVIVKGADGKIKKFTSSKTNGSFEMELPSVEGCRLEVSMMSFAKQSIPLDSVSLPQIEQDVPQKEIAEYLQIDPITLCRIKKSLLKQ